MKPRDLDLQLRLAALRVAVEDLDDDAGAVEDLHAGGAFEVSRLARREIVVDGDDVDLGVGVHPVVVDLVLFVLVAARFGLALQARLVLALRRGRPEMTGAAGELGELLQLALADDGRGLEGAPGAA